MKDKILDIVSQHCEGWKNCEELTEKLFDLYNVSQHKEVVAAYSSKLCYDLGLDFDNEEEYIATFFSNLQLLTQSPTGKKK